MIALDSEPRTDVREVLVDRQRRGGENRREQLIEELLFQDAGDVDRRRAQDDVASSGLREIDVSVILAFRMKRR